MPYDPRLDSSVLDEFRGALVALSPEGEILSWDAGAEAFFGYTSEEAVHRSFLELSVPADGHDEARRQIQQALQSGAAAFESTRRRKDGRLVSVDVSLLRRVGPGDRVFLVASERAAVGRDLSGRMAMDGLFRGLLEAAPDAMVMADQAGRIVLVNVQAERLFGYSRLELLGQPVEILVPDRFREKHVGHRSGFFADPRFRGMGIGMELFGRRRDGTEFPVEISLSPLQTEDGVIVSSAIRDISERKRLVLELEEERRRALAASRMKSEFLANMSHELRTPLNAIVGFAELMHDGKVGPVSAEHREYLGDILTSSRHLLHLINGVLDLAKVEAGKVEFRPQPVDLQRLVGEVRDVVRTLAASRRIAVLTEIDPGLGPVESDHAKLKQVLYNYLSNALKFSPEGGEVRVRVGAEGSTEFRVEVEDSGIGIGPEDLGRLFVEFQQLDSGSAKRHQGTGLGLALTRRLVEAQGGRVVVTSVPGQGSVFFAVLPRSWPPAPRAGAAAPAPEEGRDGG